MAWRSFSRRLLAGVLLIFAWGAPVSNPYSEVDLIVRDQFQEFSGLTALAAANRIRFSDRKVDIRQEGEAGDWAPTIWITPGLTTETPFVSTHDAVAELNYEITIIHPYDRWQELRALEWQVKRAATYMMDFEDAAGVALTAPAGWRWLQPILSQFSVERDDDGIYSRAQLRVPIATEITTIKADSTAPTLLYAYRLTPVADTPGNLGDIVVVELVYSQKLASDFVGQNLQFGGFFVTASGANPWWNASTSGVNAQVFTRNSRSFFVAMRLGIPVATRTFDELSYNNSTPLIIGTNGVNAASFTAQPLTDAGI